MARKAPDMVKVRLSADPYDTELFCPFCGEQILGPGGDGMGSCEHLLHASIGLDGDVEFEPTDLCFVYFEPAPASREHCFVFREPRFAEGDGEDEDD
jgi:hypothetical protein